jgi:hypothetical protein
MGAHYGIIFGGRWRIMKVKIARFLYSGSQCVAKVKKDD